MKDSNNKKPNLHGRLNKEDAGIIGKIYAHAHFAFFFSLAMAVILIAVAKLIEAVRQR